MGPFRFQIGCVASLSAIAGGGEGKMTLLVVYFFPDFDDYLATLVTVWWSFCKILLFEICVLFIEVKMVNNRLWYFELDSIYGHLEW